MTTMRKKTRKVEGRCTWKCTTLPWIHIFDYGRFYVYSYWAKLQGKACRDTWHEKRPMSLLIHLQISAGIFLMVSWYPLIAPTPNPFSLTFSVASGACSTGTATLARAQTTVNQVFAVDTETVCVKRAVVIQCSCVFLSVLGVCPCRLPGHAFPQMEAVPGAKRFGTDGNSISMYFQFQMQDGSSRISFPSPIHPQDIQTASSVEIVIQRSNLFSEIMFASPTTRNGHCLALAPLYFSAVWTLPSICSQW